MDQYCICYSMYFCYCTHGCVCQLVIKENADDDDDDDVTNEHHLGLYEFVSCVSRYKQIKDSNSILQSYLCLFVWPVWVSVCLMTVFRGCVTAGLLRARRGRRWWWLCPITQRQPAILTRMMPGNVVGPASPSLTSSPSTFSAPSWYNPWNDLFTINGRISR